MVPFDRKVKYTFFFMVQPKKDLLIEIFLIIAYTESGYSEARLSKFRHFGTILKVLVSWMLKERKKWNEW